MLRAPRGQLLPCGVLLRPGPLLLPPAAKSARAASISSIREVKEDDKALSELQTRVSSRPVILVFLPFSDLLQLEEATKVLEEKNATVSDLGGQLAKLEASLGIASETSESRLNTIKETEEAKAALEAQLEDTRNSLEKSQQQLAEITASFQAAQAEVGNFLLHNYLMDLIFLTARII